MPKKTLQVETNTLGGNLSQSTLKICMRPMAIFTFIISIQSIRKTGN